MATIEEIKKTLGLDFKEIVLDVGDRVLCDYCSDDYTDSDEQGGILFGSYATCPKCEPKIRKDAEKYNEQDHIKASCPKGKSFADWVREDLR